MSNLTVMPTKGKNTTESALDAVEQVHEVIWENCEGMPIATVLGILEIVKLEIVEANT